MRTQYLLSCGSVTSTGSRPLGAIFNFVEKVFFRTVDKSLSRFKKIVRSHDKKSSEIYFIPGNFAASFRIFRWPVLLKNITKMFHNLGKNFLLAHLATWQDVLSLLMFQVSGHLCNSTSSTCGCSTPVWSIYSRTRLEPLT